MAKTTRQSVLLPRGFSKPVTVTLDGARLSSDAGLLLLRKVDDGIGLTEALGSCLVDRREQRKVEHEYLEILRQRVFAIAAGYPDGNDAAVLADDPIMKEVCGRRGLSGAALATQATISRFENAVTGRELVGMARAFERFVVDRHAKRLRGRRVRRITIDLDPTEDRAYGQQAFAFFNGYYKNFCFLPQLGFLSFDDEPDQHLFHARLRPGNSTGWRAVFPLLLRIVPYLRSQFPRAKIRVRLDAGFNTPRTFEILEELNVEYVVAMKSNSLLDKIAEPLMTKVRAESEKTGETATTYGEFEHAPANGAWPHRRRVIVKAEVVRFVGRNPRDNARFVVTNLTTAPEDVYGTYRARGESENRIKELNLGLAFGRTSCSRFLANQLRVLMTAAAYVLFQQLRLKAKGTELARAQVFTLRDRLIKIAGRVFESVRRTVVQLPESFPWRDVWIRLART
jgi:hypothetical protein